MARDRYWDWWAHFAMQRHAINRLSHEWRALAWELDGRVKA